ncbi:hypothetical protein [Halomonas sp. KO116]|uniref:hypothetical protein n=1 Tax=Halomonas sp. KO116 TaxID=1504981 RepID=UPI0005D9DA60|nr:hypothetical protein [Halomonas sp. KO116]AJY52136.1 hypothetical protein KO116_03669 [Halomonas sp. KO116]
MLKFAAKTAASFALATCIATSAHASPIHMQDTDIREFVRWYVDQTATPLAIHPTATGTLTVYAPDVPDHQLEEFFQGVLSSHGYTILPGNPRPLPRPANHPVNQPPNKHQVFCLHQAHTIPPPRSPTPPP